MNKSFDANITSELCTIQDMLRWAMSRFSDSDICYGHGTDNPWDESIRLVLPSLFLPLDMPKYMHAAHLTSSERHFVVERVLRRIKERIPAAYLTNKAWFCGMEFYVDERVLIPRSPIGELIKDHFNTVLPCPPRHILDMCTGSGCIAIACSHFFPESEVEAADISKEALAVTERNIEAHGLEHRVIPIYSDLFCDIPALQYDLIVTNPPYVDEQDMLNLPKEFYFEPRVALFTGESGLQLVHRILSCAADYLSNHGILICEVGANMPHVIEQYPDIAFRWLQLKNGGEGVFMLTKQQLVDSKAHLKGYNL